jgi:photosynthetic reaction center H subunit
METGAITSYIDVAQLVLYAFWIFFAGLIYYLHQEDKREGYPLLTTDRRSTRVQVQGFPPIPAPKMFETLHGHTYMAPPGNMDDRPIRATPVGKWPGAPLEPDGDPMLDGVGPAAWTMRADEVDLTLDGRVKIVPLRADPEFFIETRDPDPRGMPVVAADGKVAGTVVDAWVDRSEMLLRYYEVEVAATGGPKRVLLPVNFSKVSAWRRRLKVVSITAAQFQNVPQTARADQVTLREEDRIMGYYGGGHLYAFPSRSEPLI